MVVAQAAPGRTRLGLDSLDQRGRYHGGMSKRADVECWLTDMDGVLVHENRPIPGASALLQQWRDQDKPFLVLTKGDLADPADLVARYAPLGLPFYVTEAALEDFDDAGPIGEGWKSAPLLSLLASARARLEGKK